MISKVLSPSWTLSLISNRNGLQILSSVGSPLTDTSTVCPSAKMRSCTLFSVPSSVNVVEYDGYTCVEIEDKAFEGSKERVLDSVILCYRYMRQFII